VITTGDLQGAIRKNEALANPSPAGMKRSGMRVRGHGIVGCLFFVSQTL
jgi:hypothetical protein